MEDKQSLPTIETAQSLGLSEEEYQMITDKLGRKPNFTELSVFSVMWSEHCSYKNSIKHLKTLPREGGRLLVGAGEENAGLVDIGNGLACAFKIESHNHPSAIEPYQGAATGVGGIHRDIFTMGARPIAALNSLRFGNPDRARTRHLIDGVTRGIGDYGNCLGVPTVAGEVYFHPSYNQNILVNAMSVGIVRDGATISARADGPGNPVFIVGSATGRDGIHGATFASADLTDESSQDLPAVQVGDPFQEKLLLEATLEAIRTGSIVGMQDMGAAGIACSTSEMSAKSETGMIIHLDKVPTRQTAGGGISSPMQPFEILLSESQERMLVVCKKGREDEMIEVFDKWDLECSRIGEVTDTGQLEYYFEGEKVADIPAWELVLGGGAPVYDRETATPDYLDRIRAFDAQETAIPKEDDWMGIAEKLTRNPTIASKQWIYRQYDSTVRTNTLTSHQPTDAALLRVKGTDKALAVSVDCNATYVYADPYEGARIAVAEAARNVACTGAEPVAITNCLNFGNPYNPEVYYQFTQAIKGMGDMCRRLKTPVTGGNVSFYNQSQYEDHSVPVLPTPTIGMLGLLENRDRRMSMDFKHVGDRIALIGNTGSTIQGSTYIREILGVEHSPVPAFDADECVRVIDAILQVIEQQLIHSAHDLSEGGLFIGLLESAMAGALGFEVQLPDLHRSDAELFGEDQNRILISYPKENEGAITQLMNRQDVPIIKMGQVQRPDQLMINGQNFGTLSKWESIYRDVLPQLMEQFHQ